MAFGDGYDGKMTVKKYLPSPEQWVPIGPAHFSPGSVMYTSATSTSTDVYVAFRDGAAGDKITVMKHPQ